MKLRNRLSLYFALVIVLMGVVTTLAGVRFIGRSVHREAQEGVKYDLRIAWLILDDELRRVQLSLEGILNRAEILALARAGDIAGAQTALEKARLAGELDYLALTDETGVVLARPRPPHHKPCGFRTTHFHFAKNCRRSEGAFEPCIQIVRSEELSDSRKKTGILLGSHLRR